MAAHAHLAVQPLLMKAPEAARYLGVSVTTLRTLPLPRRVLGGLRLYDRRDLEDFASALPIEGETTCQADAAFGCAT